MNRYHLFTVRFRLRGVVCDECVAAFNETHARTTLVRRLRYSPDFRLETFSITDVVLTDIIADQPVMIVEEGGAAAVEEENRRAAHSTLPEDEGTTVSLDTLTMEWVVECGDEEIARFDTRLEAVAFAKQHDELSGVDDECKRVTA